MTADYGRRVVGIFWKLEDNNYAKLNSRCTTLISELRIPRTNKEPLFNEDSCLVWACFLHCTLIKINIKADINPSSTKM